MGILKFLFLVQAFLFFVNRKKMCNFVNKEERRY